MLEKEFKYYIDNQTELVKQYMDKYIVIKDNTVIGAYPSQIEAYEGTLNKGVEMGTFLIQHCLPGTQSYTQTFHSRVLFNIN